MENMEKENGELRQELAKARKQNEKSTLKIEEVQQTLNEILQNFNAPHTQWGYGGDSPKGKRLAKLTDELGLVLLSNDTEPASHTQIGQGACRDTSPHLSIWSNVGAFTWSNTFEDLGSDHRVLGVTMRED
ncbi:hypothetical protein HPB51_005936 [Rhipicephalus microplus]|uniref:Endonuclease/exonuclease/phosphatase domain-containing protein n=1 Tax=Rhipicephalus microplus TaxID=6941 RepID=A0A9J6ERX7_RHIMP|nr:hypothetical protein HPB51_005936 [Rhipicephalus microplus]